MSLVTQTSNIFKLLHHKSDTINKRASPTVTLRNGMCVYSYLQQCVLVLATVRTRTSAKSQRRKRTQLIRSLSQNHQSIDLNIHPAVSVHQWIPMLLMICASHQNIKITNIRAPRRLRTYWQLVDVRTSTTYVLWSRIRDKINSDLINCWLMRR